MLIFVNSSPFLNELIFVFFVCCLEINHVPVYFVCHCHGHGEYLSFPFEASLYINLLYTVQSCKSLSWVLDSSWLIQKSVRLVINQACQMNMAVPNMAVPYKDWELPNISSIWLAESGLEFPISTSI